MIYAERIRNKLTAALRPQQLEIIDDSHKHKGHAGYNPQGETHFQILIVSTQFEGLSRIQRHQLVYKILAEEITGRVHALSLKVLTPSET